MNNMTKQKTAVAILTTTLLTPVFAQEITLKIADSLPAGHIITKNTTDVFIKKVKDELGERIAFEHYPAQQLAKAGDMLTITQAGITDIGYIAPAYVSEKMPLGQVVELPGEISTSCEGALAFYNLTAPGGKLDQLELKPNGVRMLYNITLSPYQAVFSERAQVASLANINGKKIRSNPGAMELSLQSVGGVPIRMTPPEIFDALTKGTIDGALLPFTSTFSYGLEQIVHSATQGANFGSVGITYSISLRKWKMLPTDVQEVLTRIGREVTENACKVFDDAEKKLAEKLKNEGKDIFTLSTQDQSSLAEKFSSVANNWAKNLDERGKSGTEILSTFRSEIQNFRNLKK